MDLHCWGHVKQQVYSKRIMNIQHLIRRIQEAETATAADILQNVRTCKPRWTYNGLTERGPCTFAFVKIKLLKYSSLC